MGAEFCRRAPKAEVDPVDSDNELFDTHAHYLYAGVETENRWSQAVPVITASVPSPLIERMGMDLNPWYRA
eukprot:15391983-Alexandrium_andersonii.AAC.1